MHAAVSHRWICGSLGRRDEAEYERLRDLIGAQQAIYESHDAVLHARNKLEFDVQGDSQVWSAGIHGPDFTVDLGNVELRIDESGAVPIFTYRGDNYVLFSSSVDALVRCLDRPLHIDWAAWSEILTCASVLGQRTPFEEIRRLPPSTTVTWSDDRLTFHEHAWPWVEDTATPTAREDHAIDRIIEALSDAVASVPAESLAVPLSGGWDSRFLAAVASGQGRRLLTATAPTEHGRDEEVDWAEGVAHHLGSEHKILELARWAPSSATVATFVDYLTSMHFWYWPLTPWIDQHQNTVLDGLAGDVLIKNLRVPNGVLDDPNNAHRLIMTKLSTHAKTKGLLAEPFAAQARSHIKETFDVEWERLRGHASAATLLVYRLRTRASVALSPMMLLAAYTDVATPFLHPNVVRASLSVDPRLKVDGRLYAKVVERIDGTLAALPSTIDSTPARTRQPADMSAEAVAVARRRLDHAAIRPLIGTKLQERIATGQLRSVLGTWAGRRTVHGLVLLSRWLTRYEDRLAN